MHKQYSAYKDSGIRWIGEIPISWRINKLKHTTYIKGRIGWQALTTNEYIAEGPYLVTGTDFLNGRINWESCFHVSQERYEMDPYIKLRNEDLLITKDGSIGKVAVIKDLPTYATLNSGIFLTRPFRTNTYSDEFMYWILVSDIFSRYIDYTSKGSTISHLYQEVFREFIYPAPSLDEQKVIADYLNRKTTQIEDLISKKERMIELLKEERTAIINQAVTKGLNPKAEMKDSGIEWVGKIPKHWYLEKLKYVSRINIRALPETTDEAYEFNYIDIGNVNIEKGFNVDEKLRFGGAPSRARRIVTKGDTIISTVRTYLKAIAYISEDVKDIIVSTGFAVISPHEKIIPKYLYYILRSEKFIDRVCALSVGVSYPAINSSELSDISIWYSDNKDEQEQIVRFLDNKTAQIDAQVAREQKSIELLRKYCTSLISEVVTGKIDVRN